MIFSWNFYGLGNPVTVQRLKGIQRKNDHDIVFLMETKNPTGMLLKELHWLQSNNYFAVPPHTPGGGGLFLSWKKDMDLQINSSSNNFIDATVSYKDKSFHATFVYGKPD